MKKVITIIGLVAIGSGVFYSFTPKTPNPAKVEYMTIVGMTTGSAKGLNVSLNGNDFKQIDLPKDNKGYYDFNFFLKFVNEYEGYGWKLEASTVNYSVSGNGNATVFGVMKKGE